MQNQGLWRHYQKYPKYTTIFLADQQNIWDMFGKKKLTWHWASILPCLMHIVQFSGSHASVENVIFKISPT